eukprot:gb/GECG01008844.1/.p1 GENE.gb/GECG01008844.1/~~gb/GECG01008844.1/.p1  ORF type:complete len:650 (+),score=44.36 gb/GECG01008844.1/:1-1950(+)
MMVYWGRIVTVLSVLTACTASEARQGWSLDSSSMDQLRQQTASRHTPSGGWRALGANRTGLLRNDHEHPHQNCGTRVQYKYNCQQRECKDRVSGFINYIMIYDCQWSSVKPLVWIGFVLWLCFLLYMLGNTADAFFCPALEVIVAIFKVSPDVAGVTFLSFGNGAPDVFASLAAYISGEGQVGVSAIAGAGVFVVTIVVGAICLTDEVQLSRRFFLRDVGFYCIAVIYLAVNFWVDSLTIGQSLGFIFLYTIYALIATCGERLWGDPPDGKETAGVDTRPLLDDPEATNAGQFEVSSRGATVPSGKETESEFPELTTISSHSYIDTAYSLNKSSNNKKLQPSRAADGRRIPGRETCLAHKTPSEDWEFALTAAELDQLTDDVQQEMGRNEDTKASDGDQFHGTRARFLSVQPGGIYPRRMGASEKRLQLRHHKWRNWIGNDAHQPLFHSNYKWVERLLGSVARKASNRSERGTEVRRVSRKPLNVSQDPQTIELDNKDTENGEDEVSQFPLLERWFGAKSYFGVFTYYLLLPSFVLRKMSVPVLQWDDYQWQWVAITPTFGTPWIVFTVMGIVGLNPRSFVEGIHPQVRWLSWALIFVIVGFGTSVLLYIHLRKRNYPGSKTLNVLTVFAFLSSVCWVINAANEIGTCH